jgi:outer membrane receptor for ferrienterochelin and colicins
MRRLGVVCLLVALGMPSMGSAEEDCAVRLDEAQRLFTQGRLDRVEAELEACLQRGFDLDQRLVALRLVAEVRLAEDDTEGARQAIQEALKLDPELRVRDARPRLAALIESERGSRPQFVSSVSKTAEDPRRAPATFIVVTAEEIARRGYLDLEQILHDLPGFDISRQQGQPYSNIYPRGLRTTETNRLLLLVDGVEENDLATGAVWLSRQYPLHNVERVEVIYGPSSTLYGANAYAGVINVVTKSPDQILGEGERFGVSGEVTVGSWATDVIDVTVAGRNRGGSLRWSLTGRRYTSDEFDFSSLDDPDNDDWDYDPAIYDGIDYGAALALTEAREVEAFEAFLMDHPEVDCRGQDGCFFAFNPDGTVTASGAAQETARGLDQAALDRPVGGALPGFTNPTEDWLVQGKFQLDRLELGFQSWRREEAANPPLIDQVAGGGDNGFLWIPRFTSLYMRYSRLIPASSLTLNFFARFKRHELDGDSATVFLSNYARGSLGLEDLLLGNPAEFRTRFEARSNSQLRVEASAVYESPSERFDLVVGTEARFSSVGAVNIVSGQPNADETGRPAAFVPGGNDIDSQDLGIFAQASYDVRPQIKLVAGGRLDNNRIRSTEGYGTKFTPRLAVIYTPEAWTFKAIYSEAFQDAPNFQRFSLLPGQRELPAPDLRPALVKNLELVAAWQPTDAFAAELALYEARYSDIVEEVGGLPCTLADCTVPTSSQFQNIGAIDITGVQLTASYTREKWSAWGNYSTTDPTNQDDGRRTSDIADHRINVGFSRTFQERLELALRANWVSARDVGAGTSPGTNPAGKIDSFLVVNGAFTWKDVLPKHEGLELQLIVNNLLDEEYYHPGIRNGAGTFFASRIPQAERAFFLRLRYSR